jgi:hypothetical protein
MTRDGVIALCGIRFELPTTTGGHALPGQPPDPDQICPDWLRKVNAQ